MMNAPAYIATATRIDGKHQPDGDEYPAQRRCFGCAVDLAPSRKVLHDKGLPHRHHCHTSALTGHRSAGG